MPQNPGRGQTIHNTEVSPESSKKFTLLKHLHRSPCERPVAIRAWGEKEVNFTAAKVWDAAVK
jgi:hypothetical protein